MELKDKTSMDKKVSVVGTFTREELTGNVLMRQGGGSQRRRAAKGSDWGRRRQVSTIGKISPSTY